MDNLLKKRPKLGKQRDDLLNAIVNRSRKRKPSNQNQEQTRKNRNAVKSMIAGLKESTPEYGSKKDWLDELDALLKEQQQNATNYVKPKEKPKRVFKVAQSVLEKAADTALKKVSNVLEAKGVEPVKKVFKVKVEEPKVPAKVEAPKVEAPKAKSPEKAFPMVFTKSKTGKVQQWHIQVVRNQNGTAKIITKWGYKDGKQATSEKEITEGKNKGKANETTPYTQALLEAKSAWEKKTTSDGYAQELGDAALPGVASSQKASKEEAILPMLAQNYRKQSRKIKFPCYVQAKLDGVRSIYRNGVFTSRTAKPFGFLDHITKELKPATDAGLILDGEIYSTSLSFQEFVGLVKKKHLKEKDIENLKQVHLWVYDTVNDQPFENRLATLVDFFSKHEFAHVHLLPTEECKTKEDIKKFHDKYVQAGYEGVIIRNKQGLYRLATRSENLQKFKEFEDAEFKIIGFDEGDGNEKGAVIWVCETEQKKQFRVRPKGSVEDRRELFKKAQSYVGKKLTVKYQELSDDGIPRFPVGIAIRDYE